MRVETERRIKALEADLEQAQISKKERANAVRYHKVKFFGAFSSFFLGIRMFIRTIERQKVVRKLTQTKKRLETAEASSKSELEHALTELRVDLNYILVSSYPSSHPRTDNQIRAALPQNEEIHFPLPT